MWGWTVVLNPDTTTAWTGPKVCTATDRASGPGNIPGSLAGAAPRPAVRRFDPDTV